MQASTVQAQSSPHFIATLPPAVNGPSMPATGPQLRGDAGGTPQAFFDAARNGDVGALATMLAAREASPTAIEPKSGMSALMLAVLRG
jgi:hypothetical protein